MQDLKSATRDLKLFNPTHIEIIADSAPYQLVDLAGRLGLPFDVWIASARTAQLAPFLAAARTLLAPTFEAFFLASSRGANQNLKFQPIRPKPLAISRIATKRPKTAVIVAVAATEHAFLAIRAMLDEISVRGLEYDVLIAGTTINDGELMSYPHTFVTGPVESEIDLADALVAYNVFALVVGFDEALFGHPTIEAARNSQLPVAFVDWSKAAKRRKRDLSIPDTADHKTTANLVANWLESGCAPG